MRWILWGVVSLALVGMGGPPDALAAQRLGLYITQEELTIWRQRAVTGPYKSIGDVSTNSPGDWDRIVANKETFRANTAVDFWDGGNWPTNTCVTNAVMDANAQFPGDGNWVFGDRVRDAAFFALVLNGDGTSADAAAKVRTFLLTQAQDPTADFRNKSMLCDGVVTGDGGPLLGMAPWLKKLLMAYEFILIRGGTFSAGDRAILDPWFLEAARFTRGTMFGAAPGFSGNFAGVFPTAEAGFETTVKVGGLFSVINAPYNTCPMGGGTVELYEGGPVMSNSWADAFSNRGMNQVAYMAMAGTFFTDAELIRHAKMMIMSWLTYSVWADGADNELKRVHDFGIDDEDHGHMYLSMKLGNLAEAVDVLARGGDRELYDYATSAGVCQISQNNTGGPKSVLTSFTGYAQYIDHTVTRYCPDCTATTANRIDLEHRRNPPTCDRNGDIFSLPIVNHYYQSTYLKNMYMRQATGGPDTPPVYPSGATLCAANFYTWGGSWGTFPGILFMFGNLEGQVGLGQAIDPYDLTASTAPTCTITAPNGGSDTTVSSTPLTTLAGTASDDVAVSTVAVACSPSCGSPTVSGTTSWSVASLPLQVGENVITCTATDGDSQQGTDQITVTYTPPAASVTSPASVHHRGVMPY